MSGTEKNRTLGDSGHFHTCLRCLLLPDSRRFGLSEPHLKLVLKPSHIQPIEETTGPIVFLYEATDRRLEKKLVPFVE